jgi:hypothetical protein
VKILFFWVGIIAFGKVESDDHIWNLVHYVVPFWLGPIRRTEDRKVKLKSLQAFMVFPVCFLTLGLRQEKSSIQQSVLPSTGLSIGQQMPPFTTRDQFGHVVSSETLKGPNGTVLLFFRSADW